MEVGEGQGGWTMVKGRAVAGNDIREGCQGQIVAVSYTAEKCGFGFGFLNSSEPLENPRGWGRRD